MCGVGVGGLYSYFIFCARERNFESVFFSQLIELFHRTMEIIRNQARYEIFRPKLDVQYDLWH